MPHYMVHKVLLSSEAFLANVAAMRCLARVFAHVVHHVFFACECFCAVLASKINRVFVLFKIQPRLILIKLCTKLSVKIYL